ncbi:hypothetical protein [Mesorhizobium sp. 113-3-3]|uniref:hypothetical protein n=1 Tax=Mesorhizobium sp. 113-3-3 TaxID=2744516 RepID=UPI0018EA81E4|nr:hypothetical protein [Mesorhizobium sp. 113-3-3]BCG83707.1 hypothetical protein MesoLj113b_72490 [Mesorhizobium sp. 113-3-3]
MADGRDCGGEEEDFTDQPRRNALTSKGKTLARIFPHLDVFSQIASDVVSSSIAGVKDTDMALLAFKP